MVLEALAAGIPVIASNIPGVREIAGQTAGVQVVDLAEPDSKWSEVILSSFGSNRGEEIQRQFEKSPFIFSKYFDSTLDLWRGSRTT